ncbi:hypothetical protein BS78_03G045600 [Paspalum vaginatum]|nr:hypothetical protein BS78_03G045600 [Paspalum vaginatum]
MENEGSAADGASRWEASPNGVIVLPAGSAAPRQPPHLGRMYQQHQHQEREAEREWEQEMQHPGAGGLGEHHLLEPSEKVFYKTKLCDKFEVLGKCVYEDGCTFAHGQGELRPPLPVPPALIRRRPLPPPSPPLVADSAYYAAGGGGGGYYGKVCFEFRDKGTCHFGDRCAYAHATAAEIAEMRYPGGPRSVEHALRNSRAPSPLPAAVGASRSSSSSSSYAPPRAFAFPSVPAAAPVVEDGRKVSRLELLSRKNMRGIYGDWPEQDCSTAYHASPTRSRHVYPAPAIAH